MEQTAWDANAASNYWSGDVIGVLLFYDTSDANPYIGMPTSMGVARNTVMMTSCDAVVALDQALFQKLPRPDRCTGLLSVSKKMFGINVCQTCCWMHAAIVLSKYSQT